MSVAPLFLPADKIERLPKAMASGADAIILDLEDGVAPAGKAAARAAVAGLVNPQGKLVVRVNAAGTPWHNDDLAMIRTLEWRPAVMLAKAERPELMRPHGISEIWALIESAAGLATTRAIAGAGVSRLVFGSADFSADIGCAHEREPMLAARSEIVLATRLASIAPAVDGVCMDFNDVTMIEDDARYSVAIGFGGKLCIHPRQVAPILAGFRPTGTELAWAHRIIATGQGASAIDGEMVDPPIRARASQIIARARG